MSQSWEAAQAAALPGHEETEAFGGNYASFKRCFDAAAVLLSLPIWLPLIAILALLVRRDGGKAFFGQARVGRDGRVFTCWKLRTMVPDAERLLEHYLAENPAARTEWDHTQKLRNDPRITPVGRFLRASSADELPQLWNVLVGEMSLVGPRPMLPEQRQIYPGTAYYRLRPGITGFWQVSDRNQSSFASRAVFDAQYARSMSLPVDLLVLLKTVTTVIKGTGW